MKIAFFYRFCILATGSCIPKMLSVKGENKCDIVHDLMSLEALLNHEKNQPC